MSKITILKKLIVLVAILFVGVLYADEGAVTFIDTAQSTEVTDAKAIDFDGTYVYVANGTDGIVVFDDTLSKVTSVSVDSKDIVDISVSDNNVTVVDSDAKVYLYSFDGSDLTAEDDISIGGTVKDIKISGSYIYVANGVDGIKVIDISDTSDIKEVANLETNDASSIKIKSDVLYLADGWGGLNTIDISTPSDLTSVDVKDGNYIDIAIDNIKLIALTDDYKLDGYDISNSLLPVKKNTNSVDTINSPTKIVAYDSNVYTMSDGSIRAYSIVDLANITDNNSEYTKEDTPKDIIIASSYAYISNVATVDKVLFKSDLANTIVESVDAGVLPKTINATLPEGEDDIDVIQINPSTGILNVNITTSIELQCIVKNQDEEVIQDINNSSTKSDISFSLPVQGGTYYIQINGIDSSYGDYQVALDVQTDDYPDSIAIASIIYDAETIDGNIVSSADKDVFKVYVPSSGTITVSSSSILLNTKFYDNNNNALTSSGTLEQTGVSCEVSHSGYYFIELTSSGEYDYSFHYNFVPTAEDIHTDSGFPALKVLASFTDKIGETITSDSNNIYFGLKLSDIEGDSFDTNLTKVANLNELIEATDFIIKSMTTIGGFAYMVANDGQDGEIIKYDISSSTIENLGTYTLSGQPISNIVLDGVYAYSFYGNNIYIFNISANRPVLEKTIDVGDTVNAIDIKYTVWNRNDNIVKTRNKYLYIATPNGLKIYSLDDDTMLNNYDTDNSAISYLKIYNNRLYAIRDNVLKIYDISVPVYASLLGSVNVNGDIKHIVSYGSNLILSPYVQIIDITNERTPRYVSSTTSEEKQLIIRDNIAYAISDTGLQVYEIQKDYGDSVDRATSIAPTSVLQGNISSIATTFGKEDIDYLRIYTQNSGTLSVSLDSSDSSIKFDAITGDIGAGTYSIKVFSDTNSSGTYTLSTVFVADDYTDNINEATLQPFTSNNTINIDASLLTSADKDYYKIVLDRRGELNITVSGDADAKISLIDADKTTIYNKSYNTTDGEQTYTVDTTLNPGTYYVLVESNSDDTKGNYNLVITFNPTDDLIMNQSINYDQLVYGASYIYTMYNNKLNIYSHILNKIGEKDLHFDINSICSKPIVVADKLYFNLQNSANPTNCDSSKLTLSGGGYVRYGLNLDQDDYGDVSTRWYDVRQDAYMRLDYSNWLNSETFSVLSDSRISGMNYNSLKLYDSSNYNNTNDTLPVLDEVYTKKFSKGIVEDNYFYTYDSDNNNLYIYDVSDKADMTLISTLPISHGIKGMLKVGDYIYLNVYDKGFYVIDVSNSSNPSVVFDGFDNYIDSYSFTINDDYLYLRQYHGFQIYNIATPSSPRLVSEYMDSTTESTYTNDKIVYDEDKIYLPYRYGNTSIIDVSNKSVPTFVSNYSNITNIVDMRVYGDTIYFATNYKLYKLSRDTFLDDGTPEAELDTNAYDVDDIYIFNDNIYINTSNSIYGYNLDINDTVSSIDLEHYISSISSDGSDYFITYNEDGFEVLDELDSSSTVGSNLEQPYRFNNITTKDSVVYATGDNAQNTFMVFNLENDIIEKLKFYSIDDLNITSNLSHSKIDGNILYLFNYNTIVKFDITSPKEPSFIASQNLDDTDVYEYSLNELAVSGDYGYFTDVRNHNIIVVDLSTLELKTVVDISPNIGNLRDERYTNVLAIEGDYLYVGTDNSFGVYDISDKVNPVFKNRYMYDYENVKSLVIDGTNLYVSFDSKLIKYDISNPLNLVKMEEGLLDNTGYYYDETGTRVSTPYDNSSNFVINQSEIYGDNLYGMDSETLKIINLNYLHQNTYQTTVSNLSIVYGDSRYIYEYGKLERTIYGEESNQYVLSRLSNNTDFYMANSRGQYDVDGNITSLRSDEDIVFIAKDDSIEIVLFEDDTPNLKSTLTFDNTIEHMEVDKNTQTLYVHLKGESRIKTYNYDTLTNIVLIDEADTSESINSIYIQNNILYTSSEDYGVKAYSVSSNGILSEAGTFENIGVKVSDVYSSDSSTFNYTAIEDGVRKLKVFILDHIFLDGISDSSYSTGDTDNPPKEGCFIATAAYGSYFEPNVKVLRDFRDHYLKTNAFGRMIVSTYYKYSPAIARDIAHNEFAKESVRIVLTPIVYMIKYPLYFVCLIGLFLLFSIRRRLLSYI